jgi:hypothetical protein
MLETECETMNLVSKRKEKKRKEKKRAEFSATARLLGPIAELSHLRQRSSLVASTVRDSRLAL